MKYLIPPTHNGCGLADAGRGPHLYCLSGLRRSNSLMTAFGFCGRPIAMQPAPASNRVPLGHAHDVLLRFFILSYRHTHRSPRALVVLGSHFSAGFGSAGFGSAGFGSAGTGRGASTFMQPFLLSSFVPAGQAHWVRLTMAAPGILQMQRLPSCRVDTASHASVCGFGRGCVSGCSAGFGPAGGLFVVGRKHPFPAMSS